MKIYENGGRITLTAWCIAFLAFAVGLHGYDKELRDLDLSDWPCLDRPGGEDLTDQSTGHPPHKVPVTGYALCDDEHNEANDVGETIGWRVTTRVIIVYTSLVLSIPILETLFHNV
jgi:hypothetical protein